VWLSRVRKRYFVICWKCMLFQKVVSLWQYPRWTKPFGLPNRLLKNWKILLNSFSVDRCTMSFSSLTPSSVNFFNMFVQISLIRKELSRWNLKNNCRRQQSPPLMRRLKEVKKLACDIYFKLLEICVLCKKYSVWKSSSTTSQAQINA
jgi:hypothetical protein